MNSQPTTSHSQKRKIGLFGLCAVAVAGSTPMIFTVGSVFATQGTAAISLMLACVIVSALAVPGFIELVLMYPNKEGGIAGVVGEAFKPYNPIIGNLAGTFYWWSWFEGSSFAATLVATVIKQLFPTLTISVPWIATIIILFCTLLSFGGMKVVTRLLIPFALSGVLLSVLSIFVPLYSGSINWTQAFDTTLKTTFGGAFGQFTSIMAGMFFLAYAIPAYETTLVYVSETKNPAKNVPRAMYFGTLLTGLYYVIIPLIWLGSLGASALAEAVTPINPVYAPLFGHAANIATGLFFLTNATVTCFEALNNSPRTLAQIADDGLMPEFFGWRTRRDVPWVATLITAGAAVAVVWINAPSWFLAAVSFEYVLCLVFASVAVWLLRKDMPEKPRLYRAPKGFITLGLVAAGIWILTTIFGFQQFGLSTMIAGIAFAFTGIALYFWRKITDRKKLNLPAIPKSLHLKLSGTLVSVLVLDAVGYLIAVNSIAQENTALIVVLEDIFVVVALLTLTIGFILPGMIAHAAIEISDAAKKLVGGTLRDFSNAMEALGKGNLESAHANIDIKPVKINSADEIGEMAYQFNQMQEEIKHAAIGLDNAREGLKKARDDLREINYHLEERVTERTKELSDALDDLSRTQEKLIESERLASLGSMVAGIAHEVNTPLGIGVTAISYFNDKVKKIKKKVDENTINSQELSDFLNSSIETTNIIDVNLKRASELITSFKRTSVDNTAEVMRTINLHDYMKEIIISLQPILKSNQLKVNLDCPSLEIVTYPGVLFQVITILINNSVTHGYDNAQGGVIDITVKDENNHISLIYCDNGKGISEDLRKKIFEPFYTTRRNQGGVGLGLFLAYNKISQIMHGSIECITPKSGKGVCFAITFEKIIAEEPV